MINNLVSLCVLAYKRPQLLKECLDSIWQTADFPYQLIVNLDAWDVHNSAYIYELYDKGRISNLVLNGGNNRGVGRSFQNCLGLAEGEYIFKIDTDLIFRENWLSTGVKILKQNKDIGAVSLFDYRHYDPNDTRFNRIEEREDCSIVNDFVSSVFGFRRKDLTLENVEMPDDGIHTTLQSLRGKLAITKVDYVKNDGFGINSVYVTMPDKDPAHAYKTPTHQEPLIFKKGLSI